MQSQDNTVMEHTKAWITDSRNINGAEQIHSDKIPLIYVSQLDNFFDNEDHDKYILVGNKGTGKSLALTIKAVKMKKAGVNLIPNFQPYISSISDADFQVNPRDNEHIIYFTHTFWRQLWELVISSLCVYEIHRKQINTAFSEFLECPPNSSEAHYFDLIGNVLRLSNARARQERIGPLLSLLINNRLELKTLQSMNQIYVRSKLYPLDDEQQFAICIDSIDEAFSDYKRENEQGESLWCSAQTAIIDAAFNLNQVSNRFVRVFAAVRSEAYREYPRLGARSSTQVMSWCLSLDYEEGHLKEIFYKNVFATKKSQLQPTGRAGIVEIKKDPVTMFFGKDKYDHPYVTARQECPLQYVLRHTFYNPRELVSHGAELANLQALDRHRRSNISRVVNQLSHQIFIDKKNAFFPQWNPNVDHVFKDMKSSVLSMNDVIKLDEKYESLYGVKPIDYLWRRGFIGVPVDCQDDPRSSKQIFCDLYESGEQEQPFPTTEYYLIHPCLNEEVCGHLSPNERGDYYNNQFIIGQGLPCPKRLYKTKVEIIFDPQEDLIELRYYQRPLQFITTVHNIVSNGEVIAKVGGKNKRRRIAEMLFAAIIWAMYENKTNNPTKSEIVDGLDLWIRERVFPDITGNKGMTTMEYFSAVLSKHKSEDSAAIKGIRSLLKEHPKMGLKLSLDTTEDGNRCDLEGISWHEIKVITRSSYSKPS